MTPISTGQFYMIGFEKTPALDALVKRTRDFVIEKIIPFERDERQFPHGPSEDMRKEMVALAKAEGLLSPHVGKEWGGLGLNHTEKAAVFEAAGYSPLGPIALNCAAPDEGNMHLLEEIASEDQKERWLHPLAAGDIRSCFCMTEPGGRGLIQGNCAPRRRRMAMTSSSLGASG